MSQTFTIDLNQICSACGQHHAIAGTLRCPHCTDSNAALPTPQTPRSPTPPVRGLAASLLSLIVRAEKAHDERFHNLPMLTGGLNIEVGLGKLFNLRMWRKDSSPSATEWRTVVNNLPAAYQPTEAILPRDFDSTERDGTVRHYLEGHWTFQTRKL
jgi:hypothetical protein